MHSYVLRWYGNKYAIDTHQHVIQNHEYNDMPKHSNKYRDYSVLRAKQFLNVSMDCGMNDHVTCNNQYVKRNVHHGGGQQKTKR